MSAQLSPHSRQEPSTAARAAAAGAVALVLAGAGLAWALLVASGAAVAPVAAGGGVAAAVIVAAVAAAVYYAETARRARARAVMHDRETRQLEREFAELAQETLPTLARQVRDGAAADEIFATIPRPDSGSVRVVLTTFQRLLSGVLDESVAAKREAADETAAARREAMAAAQREAAASAERSGVETEAVVLADETIPAAIGQMRAGEPKDTVLAGMSRPASLALGNLLDTVVTEVAVAERRGASAMAACANAAARVQAQTTRMLAELREMEQRYGEDKVFADLMELDHRVSQMGRLADSIALLAGGRSGRRWTRPIQMESILRGAMGRIDAYQRIRVHSTSTAAIAGYAAEGVMHALAELMDNATAFSAHGSEVHVYVEEEDAGLVITIEDSGLGMRRRERDRAEELVSVPLDLATLPGTRLGLAVVGRVAARYGLSINFRPSSRGGTGVVVMIPRPLISQPKGELGFSWTPGFSGEASAAAVPVHDVPVVPTPSEASGDEDNLPVRPRGRTLAEATRPAPDMDAGADSPQRPVRSAGSRFAAFRQAGGRGSGEFATQEPRNPQDLREPDAGSDEDGSKGSA
jgi:signal transduction histidine kinase